MLLTVHSDSGVSAPLVLLTALGRHSHQPTFTEKSFEEHLLRVTQFTNRITVTLMQGDKLARCLL